MNKNRVGSAIRHGLAYLQSVQQVSGAFHSDSSPTKFPFKPIKHYQTTFTPALILSALSHVSEPTAQLIRQKLAAWLLAQKSPNWSFNYWATDAPERSRLPYPNDLDDTFCALIALYQHDPSLIDETCLASVVKLLLATESQVGGPYRTWLVPKEADAVWQDVDLAVNANIACFLRLVAEPLPNLNQMIEQAIRSRSLHSPYYPSPYPIIYYLARAYAGQESASLAHYIKRQRKSGGWQSPLRNALAVSALIQLEGASNCRVAIEQLCAAQNTDGSWPAEAFCLDPALHGKKHYNGSAALTTSLAVEALGRYALELLPARATSQRPSMRQPNPLHTRLIMQAHQELTALKPVLRRYFSAVLERTQKTDKDYEIALLPHFFNQSLKQPTTTQSQLFEHLGLANLYGWVAYTIFDDFLDDEGDPALLPVATVALRYSMDHFAQALPENTAFQQTVAQTFNTIDSANAWEVTYCRFKVRNGHVTIGKLPRYGSAIRLAERSLGHALTPLGVLVAQGINPHDPPALLLTKALKHYLTARQLNDDLHDWERDIQNGHASYVVTFILKDLQIEHARKSLKSLIPRMQRQFWHHTLVEVCNIITSHTRLARTAISQSQLLTGTNMIIGLLDCIDSSVAHTISEQTKAVDFLAAYRGNAKPK